MDIDEYLQENKAWHRFIDKPETIHTADASRKTGIELHKITKSLVILNESNSPFLAIIPGDCKLCFNKIRNVTISKRIRMATFEEAERCSGYLPGATPMVHHKLKMSVVLDKKLTKYDTIFGGGGSRTKLLEMKVSDVIRLNKAVVADITE